jgi:hypothetical protein
MEILMTRITRLLLVPLLALPAFPSVAQESKPAPVAEKPKADVLLISGDGFAFSVKEPEGWRGDTGAGAAKYQANVVFFPQAAESKAADITIRVRLNDKADENTAADLQADMDGYRKQYPRVQFGENPARHADYATFAKLFFQPGSFYEYTAYLNPGPKHPFTVSVAMSKANSAATPAELAAYETVLKSLKILAAKAPESGHP